MAISYDLLDIIIRCLVLLALVLIIISWKDRP